MPLAIPLALSANPFKLCCAHIHSVQVEQRGPCRSQLALAGDSSRNFATLQNALSDAPKCSAALLRAEFVIGKFHAPNSVEGTYRLRFLKFRLSGKFTVRHWRERSAQTKDKLRLP